LFNIYSNADVEELKVWICTEVPLLPSGEEEGRWGFEELPAWICTEASLLPPVGEREGERERDGGWGFLWNFNLNPVLLRPN
jgi:hypothetical protein